MPPVWYNGDMHIQSPLKILLALVTVFFSTGTVANASDCTKLKAASEPLIRPKESFPAAFRKDPAGTYTRIIQRAHQELRSGKATFSLPEILPTMEFIATDLTSMEASSPNMRLRISQALAKSQDVISNGVPYRNALEVTADFIEIIDSITRSMHPELVSNFVPKVREEFAHLLRLAPAVIVFPSFSPLSAGFFLRTRGTPLFALGLVKSPFYADGNLLSPAEYFYHDVDHIRFMIREDLIFLGVNVPDAYRMMDPDTPSSTFNALTGKHNIILDYVHNGDFKNLLYGPVEKRTGLAAKLLNGIDAIKDQNPTLAKSAELLLFEIMHEKGYPWELTVLSKQLRDQVHIQKLKYKVDSNFFGPSWPISQETVANLPEAAKWLLTQIEPKRLASNGRSPPAHWFA